MWDWGTSKECLPDINMGLRVSNHECAGAYVPADCHDWNDVKAVLILFEGEQLPEPKDQRTEIEHMMRRACGKAMQEGWCSRKSVFC